VEFIERPYSDFAGLNLMYETRLGLARHTSPYDRPDDDTFSERNCSLEGQIADIADRIAYNCHDLEDGLRAGLIGSEQLKNVEIFSQVQSQIDSQGIEDSSVRRTRAAKGIIDRLVSDCIKASKKAIARAELKTVEDVYTAGEKLVVLSSESDVILREMEEFLREKFYLHKSLMETAAKVKQWLGELFEKLCSQPEVMPLHYQQLISSQGFERTVCDYIAGMTDRYCLKILKKES
jgi:dGTPase